MLITSVGVLRINHYDVVLFSGRHRGAPADDADLNAVAIMPRRHDRPPARPIPIIRRPS
jgi:hypothetical protein